MIVTELVDDALIAGAARAFDAVLVHRDPHLSRIPSKVVGQIVLENLTR